MLKIYKTVDETGLFREVNKVEKGVWISLTNPTTQEINNLVNTNNLDIMVVDAKIIKPLDIITLDYLFKTNMDMIIFEQLVASGTLYHQILEYKEKNNYQNKIFKHSFDSEVKIPHGSLDDIFNHFDLSDDDLLKELNK